MNGRRGFSLIEVLAALLILSLILLTTLSVIYHRKARLEEAAQAIAAWQILASEAELRRSVPYGEVIAGDSGCLYEGALSMGLVSPVCAARTELEAADLKKVTITLQWGSGKRASLAVIRTDDGTGRGVW